MKLVCRIRLFFFGISYLMFDRCWTRTCCRVVPWYLPKMCANYFTVFLHSLTSLNIHCSFIFSLSSSLQMSVALSSNGMKRLKPSWRSLFILGQHVCSLQSWLMSYFASSDDVCYLEPASSVFVEYSIRHVPPVHQPVSPHHPLGIQADDSIECDVVHHYCWMELGDCGENMLLSCSDEINFLSFSIVLECPIFFFLNLGISFCVHSVVAVTFFTFPHPFSSYTLCMLLGITMGFG